MTQDEQISKEQAQAEYAAWHRDDFHCHLIGYLPDGQIAQYVVGAYNIVSGVIEYVPLSFRTGKPTEVINVLFGSVEVRNGRGLQFNMELLESIREKVLAKDAQDNNKSDYDAAWEKAK